MMFEKGSVGQVPFESIPFRRARFRDAKQSAGVVRRGGQRSSRWIFCLLLLFVQCVSAGDKKPLSELSWLAGCWTVLGEEYGTVEHWMPPAGGTMLGMARTVKRGKTVGYEFLKLTIDNDGHLIYTAWPSGQEETSFAVAALSTNRLELLNPEHDFPQRIVYTLEASDRLGARVEGVSADGLLGFDVTMLRSSCQIIAK